MQMIQSNQETKWTIGLDIGGTNIKSGIVDEKGTVVQHHIVATEAKYGRDKILDKLLRLVRQYQSYAMETGVRLDGIGIGTAGQVNVHRGAVAGATDNLPGWEGISLKDEVQTATRLSTYVDNDVNAIAMGEGWLGAGRFYKEFLCVALGTGIGGCNMFNGKPQYGRDGYAGEYGHQVVAMNGLPCTCGNSGCWEQYASVTALENQIGLAYENRRDRNEHIPQTPMQLFDRASRGEDDAQHILDQYADYIAVGLANLIHCYNPTAIVLAGAISQQGEPFLEIIRGKIQPKLMNVYSNSASIPLYAAKLGEQAGVIGAVKLFRELYKS